MQKNHYFPLQKIPAKHSWVVWALPLISIFICKQLAVRFAVWPAQIK